MTEQETAYLQHLEGQVHLLVAVLSEQAGLLGDWHLLSLEQKVRDLVVPGGGPGEPRLEGMRHLRELVLETLRGARESAGKEATLPAGSHSNLGYFDGRQLAAETMLAILIGTLDPDKRDRVQQSVQAMVKGAAPDTDAPPPDFMRGFTDCLKRLDFSRHG